MVGKRGKWSGERSEAPSETQPQRNARCRAADGSQSDCIIGAPGDERAWSLSGRGVVERVTGPTGSPGSEAKRALVTGEKSVLLVGLGILCLPGIPSNPGSSLWSRTPAVAVPGIGHAVQRPGVTVAEALWQGIRSRSQDRAIRSVQARASTWPPILCLPRSTKDGNPGFHGGHHINLADDLPQGRALPDQVSEGFGLHHGLLPVTSEVRVCPLRRWISLRRARWQWLPRCDQQ